MVKRKWLVAIDLDGTLVNQEEGLFSVSFEEISEINKLMSQGHKPIIVTGRSWSLVKPIYEKLMIDTPVIINNGSTVFDPKGRFETVNTWTSKDILQQIIEEFKKRNLLEDYLIFGEETDYSKRTQNMYSVFYENLEGSKKDSVEVEKISKIEENIISANLKLIENPESYDLIKELTKKFKSEIKFITWGLDTDSDMFEIEVMNRNIDKFKGIKKLSEILSITEYDILAIGDGENDKEMLIKSDVGVAMKNASDKVKSYADIVTKEPNTKLGLSNFLQNFNFETGQMNVIKKIQISDIHIGTNLLKTSVIKIDEDYIYFSGSKNMKFLIKEIKYLSFKEKYGTIYFTLKGKKSMKFMIEELKALSLIQYLKDNHRNLYLYERQRK